MKITGIIAEYNPFHYGHDYQIQQIKKMFPDTFILTVMSGNFVQRGEPAVFDKFTRTRMALAGGADVVIELPVCYSLQSADGFAYGGIALLDSLNCIDYLCFGSECGDINTLQKTAELLYRNQNKFNNLIKKELERGISYSTAKLNAASALSGRRDILQNPNDLLAVEYIKVLMMLDSSISPIAVKRIGAMETSLDIDEKYPSAKSIRECIKRKNIKTAENCIPMSVRPLFKAAVSNTIVDIESFYPIIAYILRNNDSKMISNIQGISEGYENRLIAAALDTTDFSSFMKEVISRRYTESRAKRALCSILLGITDNDVSESLNKKNLYARVLGFRASAKVALSYISKNSSIPVITQAAEIDKSNPLTKKDLLASDLYFLASRQKGRKDYTNGIIVL